MDESDGRQKDGRTEKRYRELMDSLPVSVVVTTPEGHVIEVNPAFVDLFGYSRDELQELGAAELYVNAEDREKILAMLKEDVVSEYEALMKRKDGSTFRGYFNSIAKISSGGETRIYTVAQDVTEKREIENRLRMLGMAVEQTIDGVIVTDLEGNILFVNRAFAAMHRYRPSDLVGEKMEILHTKDQLKKEGDTFNRELMLTGLHQGEVGRRRSDGTTFSTWTTGTLLRDKDGNAIGSVKTVHDITEQKAMEKGLNVINAELEGYAHALSSDLMRPLSRISKASRTLDALLMGGAETGTEAKESLRLIEEEADNASVLIEDLISLARAGRESEKMADVDVLEVVGKILEENSEKIEERKISVEVDQTLGHIYANPEHVYQLFSNLIDNAIEHNSSSSPNLKIRHLGEDDSGLNGYVIKDNGEGIHPDDMDRILLPFYKGRGQGTGVGLAVVDKIVGTYNGKLEVFNDNGACFKFYI